MKRMWASGGGNEGYEGMESKSFCMGGRLPNCGSPAKNWANQRGATHIFPGPDPWGVRKLKRWATVWSLANQGRSVMDSSYRVVAGLEPQTIVGMELEGLLYSRAAVVQLSQLELGGHKHLVMRLRPDDLLLSGLVRDVWLRGKRPLHAGHNVIIECCN